MPVKKYNEGLWTPARYRTFVSGALRSAFRRWPPRTVALRDARNGRAVNPKTKREGYTYACALCAGTFFGREVQVDHKSPVVGTSSKRNIQIPHSGDAPYDWNIYIERMFVEKKGLQVLCKPCHKKKTQLENKKRRKNGSK